jgi:hypothetical protein
MQYARAVGSEIVVVFCPDGQALISSAEFSFAANESGPVGAGSDQVGGRQDQQYRNNGERDATPRAGANCPNRLTSPRQGADE